MPGEPPQATADDRGPTADRADGEGAAVTPDAAGGPAGGEEPGAARSPVADDGPARADAAAEQAPPDSTDSRSGSPAPGSPAPGSLQHQAPDGVPPAPVIDPPAEPGPTIDVPTPEGAPAGADPGRDETPTGATPVHLRARTVAAPILAALDRVPVPRFGRLLRGRRTMGHNRRKRGESARGLRVNQRLWSVDPWSVFKVSALFYLCVFFVLMVAGTLLWNVGRSSGTIDEFESFVTRLGAYGSCVPKGDVPDGTEFETDNDCPDGEVVVGGFALDDGTIFKASLLGGAVLVVAGSVGNVLMTMLLNLINEVSGGTRFTIIREPVPRLPAQGSPPPRRSRAAPAARHEGSTGVRVRR